MSETSSKEVDDELLPNEGAKILVEIYDSYKSNDKVFELQKKITGIGSNINSITKYIRDVDEYIHDVIYNDDEIRSLLSKINNGRIERKIDNIESVKFYVYAQ